MTAGSCSWLPRTLLAAGAMAPWTWSTCCRPCCRSGALTAGWIPCPSIPTGCWIGWRASVPTSPAPTGRSCTSAMPWKICWRLPSAAGSPGEPPCWMCPSCWWPWWGIPGSEPPCWCRRASVKTCCGASSARTTGSTGPRSPPPQLLIQLLLQRLPLPPLLPPPQLPLLLALLPQPPSCAWNPSPQAPPSQPRPAPLSAMAATSPPPPALASSIR